MSFLFGSSKTETSIPEWLEVPAREMLQRSIDQSKTGYMPYSGPQVAALDPAQMAGMRNTNAAAQAFGMESAMPNVPRATDFGNGMMGYSSLPLYQQQQQWMTDNRPGQKSFYDSFFVDPTAGTAGERMIDAPTKTQILNDLADYGGAGDHGYGGGANVGGGGYTGLGDMMDGGGPGQSGAEFGGAFGGVSNGVAGAFGGLW